jgi:hypothetical protein
VAGTQAVYYRDARGAEPVDEFIQALRRMDAIRRIPPRAVGKDAPPASRPL